MSTIDVKFIITIVKWCDLELRTIVQCKTKVELPDLDFSVDKKWNTELGLGEFVKQ